MSTLNIVVPMAGRGSRFESAGYPKPKPLLEIHGKPMISLVINNIKPKTPHRFIFLCLKEHMNRYNLKKILQTQSPGCEIVIVDSVTEGAACTVLLARSFIDNGDPLMIANSDQWVDIRIDDYLEAMQKQHADGFIMTMTANDPKWSYVKMNAAGVPEEVVEKKVVSTEATVGIYNFREGKHFVEGADKMIRENLRVNNEFYVAPVYNQLIAKKMKIGIFNIGPVSAKMHGLGIPDDYEKFVQTPISSEAARF